VGVLTSEVMYADDAYVNARTTEATGLVHVPDVCEIAATKPVVAVAVRHRTRPAAAVFEPISSGVSACGSASLAGRAVVDVNPLGITKATAVERLLLRHGHRPQTVVAFGDMPNDLPLFAWAGYSFAVANAHSEVPAAADEVVPRNDEDGVARTLNSLVRHAVRDSRPTPRRLGRLGTPTVGESARE
jgi:hydroxymethylpyrimidine pyrophosphatase-like HAD family hydrolase